MGLGAQTTPSTRCLPRPLPAGCTPCAPPPWLLRLGVLSLPATRTWGSASSPLLPGRPQGPWEEQGRLEIEAHLHPRETSSGTVLSQSRPLDVTIHMVRQAQRLGLPQARSPVDVAHAGTHSHGGALCTTPALPPTPSCPPVTNGGLVL